MKEISQKLTPFGVILIMYCGTQTAIVSKLKQSSLLNDRCEKLMNFLSPMCQKCKKVPNTFSFRNWQRSVSIYAVFKWKRRRLSIDQFENEWTIFLLCTLIYVYRVWKKRNTFSWFQYINFFFLFSNIRIPSFNCPNGPNFKKVPHASQNTRITNFCISFYI